MTTGTDIVNIALRRVGSARVSDYSKDQSAEGRVARDLFDEARRDILTMHTWNFAIKRIQLTVSATAPAFGWDYAFPLPDDFLRVINVTSADSDTAIVPYKLEFQSSDDRVVVTNSEQIYLKYVFDCDDISIFSAPCRDALAWRLARDFALSLQKSAAAAELAEKMLRQTISRAKAIDGVEDWPDKLDDGDWIKSRHGDEFVVT